MRSSMLARSSMSRSSAEVAGVELGGSTDFGRGRWMERGHDRRRESEQGHAAWAGGRGCVARPRAGSVPEQRRAMR
jgi:hypothetical protein